MSVESVKITNKIGDAIRKFRLMKNMSAKELSVKTGIATSNISAIENGERVPKMDMCNRIANVMGVDPVEVCGLELTENDEKRLLMKLLMKYAVNVELATVGEENGHPIYDQRGRSIATLPIDFAEFAMKYEENKKDVEFAVEGIRATDPRYELLKANAEDELHYWVDMYPEYDAVTIARENLEKGNFPEGDTMKIEMARERGVLDFDLVDIWASLTETNMGPNFWAFQSEYIIPNRNEAWRAKHTKKED